MKHDIVANVIREQKLVTGITCDNCGKKIENGEDYWAVTFSHSDWGRDSIDSFEYKDYCTKECLATVF